MVLRFLLIESFACLKESFKLVWFYCRKHKIVRFLRRWRNKGYRSRSSLNHWLILQGSGTDGFMCNHTIWKTAINKVKNKMMIDRAVLHDLLLIKILQRNYAISHYIAVYFHVALASVLPDSSWAVSSQPQRDLSFLGNLLCCYSK